MKPIHFVGENCNYTAPGCDDLPVYQEEVDGHIEVMSVWQPSEKDLQILNSGGVICLNVLGGQPPVALWAEKADVR